MKERIKKHWSLYHLPGSFDAPVIYDRKRDALATLKHLEISGEVTRKKARVIKVPVNKGLPTFRRIRNHPYWLIEVSK